MALTTSRLGACASEWTINSLSRTAVNRHAFLLWTYPDIPRAELIASALLQLKNNPRIFEKWRERQGDAFKANGQIFEDTYPLTRDET